MYKLTEKDFHADYCQEREDISFDLWWSVVNCYFQSVLEQILIESKIYIFPGNYFGFLSLIKYRPKVLNLLKTLDNYPENSYVNALLKRATYGPTRLNRFCTKWDRRILYCKFYRAKLYKFGWAKNMKTQISEWIIKTHTDPMLEPLDVPLKRM